MLLLAMNCVDHWVQFRKKIPKQGTHQIHQSQKTKMSECRMKTILICFSDCNGIICKEFLPTG